jgi:hypothetical protein
MNSEEIKENKFKGEQVVTALYENNSASVHHYSGGTATSSLQSCLLKNHSA